MRWVRLLLALAMPSYAWAASQVVVSSVVSDVAVTVYRDPYRVGTISAGWPGGYALITETRTITVPRGDSQLRFENVAEGLLPETAIVTGLPTGVREKNRDARLISPAGLVDAYLKRRVLLRRTDPATGKLREQTAVVRAGPDGGVILQTADGIEALRCSGLPERILYDGVPDTLTARPTLSIITRADRPVTATIQLTYMAQGFDWSANYVGQLAPDGNKIGLFAWLTMANGGQQGFRDARLQVIAGKPNKRENQPPPPPPSAWLDLQCWPADVTSTYARQVFTPLPLPKGPDLAAFNAVGRNAPGSFETRKQRRAREKAEREATMFAADDEGASIVVTGSRAGASAVRRERMQFAPLPAPAPPPPPAPAMAMPVAVVGNAQAKVEALGDLKLYRVPMRVTIAARAQKQLAMLVQPDAAFERVYVLDATGSGAGVHAAPFELRAPNVAGQGLGVPLPAGTVALFARGTGRDLYAGEAPIDDLAVGENVVLRFGDSPDVNWTLTRVADSRNKQQWRVDISNARDALIKTEVTLPFALDDKPAGARRGKRGWVLPVEVLPNATASVSYTTRK
ncbi:MAG: hypothetical protein DCF31_08570 [Alphaproteobacteria bacterium]|nr:MAG: hypothetical protein DCF31_08570 [Alphaproteobacteria bacterium]